MTIKPDLEAAVGRLTRVAELVPIHAVSRAFESPELQHGEDLSLVLEGVRGSLPASPSVPTEGQSEAGSRPAGHCDDDEAWAEFTRQYAGKPRSRPDMTDFALANAVFMADRNSFDLIVYQTAAKERIRWLSIRLAEALQATTAAPSDAVGMSEANEPNPQPTEVQALREAVAWSCKACNSPRPGTDTCWKCGGPLKKPADGWEWPGLPDIARIRALAKEVGYAVGVHGSQERDLDLIAAPWVDGAVEPLALAEHIATGLGGQVVDFKNQDKPCGRWSCNIHTPDWTKLIDLSVMPAAPVAGRGDREVERDDGSTAESRAAEVESVLADAERLANRMGATIVRDPEKIDQFINGTPPQSDLAVAIKALEPFARLEIPKRTVGNAGAYSILHDHIRAASTSQAATSASSRTRPGQNWRYPFTRALRHLWRPCRGTRCCSSRRSSASRSQPRASTTGSRAPVGRRACRIARRTGCGSPPRRASLTPDAARRRSWPSPATRPRKRSSDTRPSGIRSGSPGPRWRASAARKANLRRPTSRTGMSNRALAA